MVPGHNKTSVVAQTTGINMAQMAAETTHINMDTGGSPDQEHSQEPPVLLDTKVTWYPAWIIEVF